ncbi:MAG TPA: hypothetical protein VGD23_03665 [Sphingomicrobium sp.]
MRRLIAAIAAPLAASAAPMADYAEPYRLLQQANLALDPVLATSAYADDARLTFHYPVRPAEAFRGHEAIRASYIRTFGQVDPESPIRLEFRFEPPGLSVARQWGVYRIDARVSGRPVEVYGRFAVELVRTDAGWRFAQDRGWPATATDFNKLPPTQLGK